ncbi:MAG: hypothetical protein ABSD38_15350 [Syntrophorhabdales bacterium]
MEVIESVSSGKMFAGFQDFVKLTGFPCRELGDILPPDVAQKPSGDRAWPFRFFNDADIIAVGNYRFQCISMPGHSPGHTCLYESKKGLFLAGDPLLSDITPGIQAHSDTLDPLRDIFKALTRSFPWTSDSLLPGHGDAFTRFKERITELKEHHRARASKIVAELEQDGRIVYEVASKVSWNVADSDSWHSVPELQKLLATGEAFAHLKYLEGKGCVRRGRDYRIDDQELREQRWVNSNEAELLAFRLLGS